MKDKRQRLAMAWPYDPAIYAYLINAAAAASFQHHYHTYSAQSSSARPTVTFPPSPFAAYYASLGLQRAAAAYRSQFTHVEHLAKSSPGPSVSPPAPIIPHSSQGHDQGHAVTGLCACAACCPSVISGLHHHHHHHHQQQQQQSEAGVSVELTTSGLFQPYKSTLHDRVSTRID